MGTKKVNLVCKLFSWDNVLLCLFIFVVGYEKRNWYQTCARVAKPNFWEQEGNSELTKLISGFTEANKKFTGGKWKVEAAGEIWFNRVSKKTLLKMCEFLI